MNNKRLLPLALAATLLLASCGTESLNAASSDATSSDSSEPGNLPMADLFGSEIEYQSFQEMADGTDAIFQGELVEIVNDWQRVEHQEGGEGDEYVGLRFEVTNLIDGKLEAKEVTVGFHAYRFDMSTKERTRTVSLNQLTISDFEIGGQYVLTILRDDRLENNYAVGVTSTIQRVNQDGTLKPLSSEDGYEKFDIDSITDLESLGKPDSTNGRDTKPTTDKPAN